MQLTSNFPKREKQENVLKSPEKNTTKRKNLKRGNSIQQEENLAKTRRRTKRGKTNNQWKAQEVENAREPSNRFSDFVIAPRLSPSLEIKIS